HGRGLPHRKTRGDGLLPDGEHPVGHGDALEYRTTRYEEVRLFPGTPALAASGFALGPLIWIVLIAGSSWISNRIRSKRAGAPPARARRAAPAAKDDERTRRVREEVRRRIAEKQM